MKNHSTAEHLAAGAAAGLGGTVLLQQIRGIGERLPIAQPPMRQAPGKFMVEQAESALPRQARQKVPAAAEGSAAKSLALGYGASFGALYGLFRPAGGSALTEGAVLGLATWAVGYLGWLPALGLMPPVTRQGPLQVAAPVAQHVVFGIVTVAAYDALRKIAP